MRELTGSRQESVADHYHESVNKQPSSDKVSKHIEASRALGKEMERSLDEVIKNLREAADALERASATTSRRT